MDENKTNDVVEIEKEEVDIMSALQKMAKKQLFYNRVICVLLLVLVLSVLILLPTLFRTLNAVNTTLNNADAAIAEATVAIETAETTLNDISTFANSGTNGLSTALEKIEAIDIEGLNSAITDLGAVVEPMAKFFGVFK